MRNFASNPKLEIPGLFWDNWRSQLRFAINTEAELAKYIQLSNAEIKAIQKCSRKFKWQITPYYVSLMDKTDANCPIRRQALPSLDELEDTANSSLDPYGDLDNQKTQRVIHKYPDRVIVLTTNACAVYCRHCTRKFRTEDLELIANITEPVRSWKEDFEYIDQHPEIRDVLLTGGDPLSLADSALERIIARLRSIKHVEIIRIGSRFPVFLPQRITTELCEMLDKYQPIWFSTHFNHPKEITEESAAACDRLLRHGIPVQNQSVLLKGVNDDAETMKTLVHDLLRIRVRPYYIYHCDNVTGVAHFATTIETGRKIMRTLHGFTTGFAVPEYVLTTPLGKISLCEENFSNHNGELWVKNYKNEKMRVETLLLDESDKQLC